MRYLVFLISLWLTACGQAGDLYLPEPKVPPPAEAAEEQKRDKEGNP